MMKTIPYSNGKKHFIGQLVQPQNKNKKHPGILLFPAFEGQSEFSLDYAKKLSELGASVFVVDLYGNGSSSETLEGCFALYQSIANDRSLVREHAQLAFNALKEQENVDPERIGAMGFCFGGTCALELLRSGAKVKAAVLAHTALAKSPLETKPIPTKILVLNGYDDPQVPALESLNHFAEEMKQAENTDWIFTFFGEAKHSFTDPKTGSFDPEKEKSMGRAYNQRSAEFTFRYAVDFFRTTLG